MNEKTLRDLEWPRLLDLLSGRCVTTRGKEAVRALAFLEGDAHARALAESREAVGTLAAGEALPVYGVRDLAAAVERLRVGAVLSPVELRDAASTLAGARMLRRFLAARASKLPSLHAALSTDPTLDDVEDTVSGAFEPDGTLSDHASPRLRELRSEYHAARARMISRLEEMLRKHAAILSDGFWTEREGRYVLPVRSDAHERFPGIVHATSQSGATLFVEPRVLVPHGNRLKVQEGEVRREEEAVYARLSAALAEVLPSLSFAIQALARADVLAATARLAVDLDLQFPDVVDAPVAELRGARHPLLAAEDDGVVPSDVSLEGGRVVVVSGPNAGGKTVALKTLGLSALMLRAGLPVPAKSTSRLGLFEPVLSDIGDDQSLTKNLSTFSAHVANLADILAAAGPRALVLLDELATGTDPREGEALAAAVLDGLASRGAAVMATTHYEGLKALAVADDRFENASVGFDLDTMTPTYALAMGVPGASSALAVARRYGLPEGVLERAGTYMRGEDHEFEDLVKKLTAERRALELARAELAKKEAEAEAARDALGEALAKLRRDKEHDTLRQMELLAGDVRRARDDVRNLLAKLRRKPDATELRAVAKEVDTIAGRVGVGGDLAVPPREVVGEPLAALRVGQRARVPRLGVDVEVLALSGDEVKVAAGQMKLTVRRSELVRPSRDGVASPQRARVVRDGPEEPAIQTRETTCDLRGLDADEATRHAEQFLDRSLSEGRRIAFLIHGHGTGVLRNAVRRALGESTYVSRMRPGEPGEGGDGVTVVWLR